MPLLYPPFKASAQLVAAAKSRPPIVRGAHGGGVLLIQGALLDLGFRLPRSTRKSGHPDGILGQESMQVMTDYQRTRTLSNVDGIIGRETMEALDRDMMSLSHPASLTPPVPVPAPVDAEYTLGTSDPPLYRDPGAGAWKSKPTEATYVGLKAAILNSLPASVVVIGDDAAAHMLHYLGNSGSDYHVDLNGMVSDVPSAKQRYEREVAQARTFVEKLGPGTYDITSLRAENGYNRKSENSNWFYAIGGYSTWGKGRAVVEEAGGRRSYRLEYEYKLFDRYNWDGGKKVTIANITVTDQFMGEFHRQGLAREFDCYGSSRRRFTWRQGELISQQQLDQSIGGRS